jgi:lactoylglutathione lyase
MAAKKTAKRSSSKKASAKKAKAAPAKADSLKMSEVSPALTVNDLTRSLAWYRDILGFVTDERWEQDGKLMGVSLKAGGVTLMIAQDDWKKGRDRKKGEGFRLYCATKQNVDALAKRIEARGGKLDQKPTDQPWGTRDFALTDPDGFKITIGADQKR